MNVEPAQGSSESASVVTRGAPSKRDDLEVRRTLIGRLLRQLVRRRDAQVAFVGILIIVASAVLAPWISAHDPTAQSLADSRMSPSWSHPLGTDGLGRDVMSRLLAGGRVALLVALQAVSIALVLGVPSGLLLGYIGGWTDQVASRLIDAIMSIPPLVLALVIIALLGPGITNAMVSIGVLYAIVILRLVRGTTLSLREEPYVSAAIVAGVPTSHILTRHILANLLAPLLAQVSVLIASAIMVEASLSFLGLGVQPPQSSWGVMLARSSRELVTEPFAFLAPAAAITLTVFAFNTLGDAASEEIGTEPAMRSATGSRRRWWNRNSDAGGMGSVAPAASVPAASSIVADGSEASDAHGGSQGPPVADEDARMPTRSVGLEPLLSVHRLTVTARHGDHSDRTIVDDVSFDIRPGETLGLVGESGCGKSMTALSVLGLLPANCRVTNGGIRLGGSELTRCSARLLRDIRASELGYVGQDPVTGLTPGLTIEKHLVEAIQLSQRVSKRAARADALEMLAAVGIPDPVRRMKAYPHELSGGMAQRITIAMALAGQPRLLIADEPTTALDVTIQGEILDLLHRVRSEFKTAILLITHDLGVVADICDRVQVMYAGHIVESGTAQEVLEHPRHPYTKALLGALPERSVDGRLALMPGRVPEPHERPEGCRFAPRCTFALPGCEAGTPPLENVGLYGEAHDVRCVRLAELAELEGAIERVSP